MSQLSECARFGHHPDPVIDFCEEVECLVGLVESVELGLVDLNLEARMDRVMQFSVGGSVHAIVVKDALRILVRKEQKRKMFRSLRQMASEV